MNNLHGRVALVTGAARGLGQGIALALARGGAALALCCREREDELAAVAAYCAEEGVQATCHMGDLAESDVPKRVIDEALARHGRLDILIANAGITLEKNLMRTADDEWDRVVEVNLGAVAKLCRAGWAVLRKSGGHVILITSHAGLTGRAGLAAYGAAKAGLVGLTQALAVEGGAANIRVNAVAPGFLLTDMGQQAGEEAHAQANKQNCLGRIGTVEESAAFIAHLAGMEHVSGQVFNLDSRPLKAL